MSLNIIKKRLHSSVCWSVVAGAGTGSLVSLDFGEKIIRTKPLKNPALSDEQRNYFGENVLYIECAWRLQTRSEVICSSTSGNLENQSMVDGLRQIIGAHVVKVRAQLPGGDMEIIFDNGISLLIFADQSNEVEKIDNYTFYSPNFIITNGPKSLITKTRILKKERVLELVR
jgi:hypothetical protein